MGTSDEEHHGDDPAADAEGRPTPANDAGPEPAPAEALAPEPATPAFEADDEPPEDMGRRVESLLAEAPDADPEVEFPLRGEIAPEPAFAAFADPDYVVRPTLTEPEEAPAEALSVEAPAVEPPSVEPGPRGAWSPPPRRSGMDRVGPIVAFDFDGTLTVRDSFTAFLKWRDGSTRYHAEMATLAPAALRYVFDRDPGKLKAAAVRRFLQGLPREVLNAEAMEFATAAAPLLFRPDALKAWRRYRQDGARLIIVTASPENIVAPFARGLGADMLIGTQLLFDQDDRVQGGLLGDNCRGPAKVRRIKEALGEDVVLTAAYGDTDGDWDMLGMAEQQFMRLFVGVPGKAPGGG